MKVNFTIPTSLTEITLDQYKRYLKETKDVTSLPKIQEKILSIFCGIELKDTFKMKAVDVEAICDIILSMFDSRFELINRFTLNGIEFGFVPNLDEMSFGAYVDTDKFIGDIDNIHLAVAALYRPVVHKSKELYSVEEYEPNKYDMSQTPLSVVLGMQVFFYNLGKDLSKVMIDYLQEEDLTYQEREVLQKNGVGFNQFTHSLKEMLQGLKISLN